MLRKILLAGIMVVSVAIIMVALQSQRAEFDEPIEEDESERTEAARRSEDKQEPIRLEKYDNQHNLVAVITGEEAEQKGEGPVHIVKPTIRILRDPNRITVITADTGYIEGTDKKRMGEGWLRGNVVMTVLDRINDDNTILTCQELQYHGDEAQVTIPGDVLIRNRSMAISGRQLTADRLMARAELQQNVRVVLKEGSDALLREMAGKSKGPDAKEEESATPPAPVIITCKEKLVFNRDDNRASFSKEVVVRQEKMKAVGDAMVVTFEKAPARPTAEGPARGSRMAIRRIIMTAEQKEGVVVTSEELEARGNRLEFDSREGLLVFTGGPCRAVQKSIDSIFQVEGNEVRFGRRRLLPENESLPEGMTADSRKVLVTGGPARAVQVPREGGESSLLSGQRILFDQDAQIVWLQGDDKTSARAERNKDNMVAREIQLFRKTVDRGRRVTAKGTGRMEIRAVATGTPPPQPTTVDFAHSMTYLTDEQRAEFVGAVRLVDQTTTSKSEKLRIEFEQSEDKKSKKMRTRIMRIVAEGNVEVVDANRTAIGEKFVYRFPKLGGFVATVTARPGEVSQLKWSGHVMRSNEIVITQVAAGGDRHATRVEGQGKGYLLYRPMVEIADEAERRRRTIEIWYDDKGVFDDATRKATFDGNVRVKKDQLYVTSGHTVVTFVKPAPKPDAAPADAGHLSVTTITATDDVTVRIGTGKDETTARGRKLVWRRSRDVAELYGSEDAKVPARVMREKNTIEAPLIIVLMSKGELYEVLTPRGGHFIGFSLARKEGDDALRKMDVTWTDTGTFRPKGSPEITSAGVRDDTSGYARVTGDVKAISEDSEITSSVVTVHLRRRPGESEKNALRLGVEKIVATVAVRLKQFLPEEESYRFGKADRLEWDRSVDRMVLESPTGDALIWDKDNQWAGQKLAMKRRSDGRFEVESTGGRPLILYEDSKPKNPVKTRDPRKWEPIY